MKIKQSNNSDSYLSCCILSSYPIIPHFIAYNFSFLFQYSKNNVPHIETYIEKNIISGTLGLFPALATKDQKKIPAKAEGINHVV